jgi:hypothetical protein
MRRLLLALLALCPVAAQNAWTKEWSRSSGGVAPIPRQAHTAVACRGSMIVFGGFGGRSTNDFLDDTWMVRGPTPSVPLQPRPPCVCLVPVLSPAGVLTSHGLKLLGRGTKG